MDPEKDKDKIKEKEDLLKSIAKAQGKDEDAFEIKTETGGDGKVYKKWKGPNGGECWMSKKDDGSWSEKKYDWSKIPTGGSGRNSGAQTGQSGQGGQNNNGGGKKKNKKKKKIHDSYECTDISDFLFEKLEIVEYEE